MKVQIQSVPTVISLEEVFEFLSLKRCCFLSVENVSPAVCSYLRLWLHY